MSVDAGVEAYAGFENKAYRGVAGATAATEMKNIMDLDWDDSMGSYEKTTRGDGGTKSFRSGLREHKLTFSMIRNFLNADYAAIREAYIARTPIAIKVTDPTGADGLDADWNVEAMKKGEPIDGNATVDVTCSINTDIRLPVDIGAAAGGA